MSVITSTSNDNASFSKTIDERIASDAYVINEDDWMQFLRDHIDLIREHSKLVPVNEQTMLYYRYRIRDFLKRADNINSIPSIEQIFRVANRLGSNRNFDTTLTSVYVPSISYAAELKRKYVTLRTKINKL